MDVISSKRIRKLESILSETSNKYHNDFLQNGATNPWIFSAVNSGICQANNGMKKHPGIVEYKSSTTASSGGGLRLNSNCILLSGGEKTTFIFKTASTLAGILRRMGFLDTSNYSECVDGVYCKINDGVLTGHAVSNSAISTTGTSYPLSADTFYRLVVQINTNATAATFILYTDDSDIILWQSSLNTNIPSTTGRELGHGDVITYSGTTSITLGYLDYIDVIIPNLRRVV